ncbi:MAG: iron ABC transporter permease [Treponemataceae bacterium]|nr:iron ABC transporter permease [Treponemataceae bacterium]
MKQFTAFCGTVLAVLLVLFFCVTAVSAFAPAFSDDSGSAYGTSSSADTSFFKRITAIRNILFYTIKQAFLSTVVAVIIGLPAAFFTACRKFPGRRFLESLSSVSLCIPPLLIALGYVIFFGMNGVFNRAVMALIGVKNPPITFLYSFSGIIIAHGFYNFPVIMRTVSDTWKNLPEDEYNAAVLSGAGKFRIFRTITLFQLAPSVAAGAVIVFLYCFFSFIIVLLFGQAGGSTMEVEVYQAARNTLDFKYAGQLALTETVAASAFVLCYVLLGKKGRRTHAGVSTIQPKPVRGAAEIVGLSVTGLLILLFLLLPLAAIVFTGAGELLKIMGQKGFPAALLNTLYTSLSSAFLCVLTAFFFACVARRADPHGKSVVFRIIPLLPMAISSIVIGFGLTNLLRKFHIAGSPFLLVIAQASLTWPLAFQQIRGAMERIPSSVTDAASLLSPSRLDVIFRIQLPQVRRALFSSFAFCVALSAGDSNLPLILGIPRFATLSLFTYRLAGSYRFSAACAAGTILIFTSMALFALSDSISGKSRPKKGLSNKDFLFRKKNSVEGI